MKNLSIYLIFNGNCEEAFNFYKDVFDGEIISLSRYKDIPFTETSHSFDEKESEKILHIALKFKNGFILMGSDANNVSGYAEFGNNFAISVTTEDSCQTEKIFNSISEGGKIFMPLGKTFWGDYFGSCTDKFGINWMISNPIVKS
jgi:PhnB protein